MLRRDEILAEIVAQSMRATADAAKISERALIKMLLGRRKCGLEEYVRICGYLGTPFGEFISHRENENTENTEILIY